MKFNIRRAALILPVSMIALLIPSSICRAQQSEPYRLTLQDAIQKALQANLNVLVAGTRVEEADGTRMRRMSAALLPRVSAQTYANAQNRNLRAFGITLPGSPEVVGPFSNYDIRVYAQQNVIDLGSYRALKASERSLDASKMDEREVRDLIVRLAYVLVFVHMGSRRVFAGRIAQALLLPCCVAPGIGGLPDKSPRPVPQAGRAAAVKAAMATFASVFSTKRITSDLLA